MVVEWTAALSPLLDPPLKSLPCETGPASHATGEASALAAADADSAPKMTMYKYTEQATI